MSNLLVQNIKHTNNTTAQTIDTSGRTTISILKEDSTYRSDQGAVTQNLVQGVNKAYINCLVTVASISESLNISSLDDDGTGDHGINLTNSFNNDRYITAMSLVASANQGNSAASCRIQSVTSRATGAVEVRAGYVDGEGDFVDDEDGSGTFYNMSLFGDLA